jgi:hypothetical protein
MATGGRKTHLQVIHQISQQFGFGQTNGIIGVIPGGAILNITHLLVSQVFNSTTNLISIGTTVGGNQLLSGIDLKTLARTDTVVPFAIAGPYGVDTPIYGTITSTGAAPTQGVATVWIDYLAGPG